ncbi:MAG TPA: UDP-2,3-diacylglucosamine diphosphatase [Gammaproteobacteria bacterium]|nr:UDP-2,3-diacylglucosamine diphosphatase [Gammaproteobacteria bacterium]
MAATVFISDLHLDPERPVITELFLDFLAGPARGCDALYILGDLFEAWVGDDDDSPTLQPVLEALADCTGTGLPVSVMTGNRDFLIGEGFTARTGCRLLPDPSVVDLYGEPTLLMHGDTLCTDDLEYQQFRRLVRDPAWQRQFLAKPLEERRHMAAGLRETSRQRTAHKTVDIMDVNHEAVLSALREHHVRRLIHGHTHRPATHELTVDGAPATRIVLGDWYEQGSVLWCDPTGCRLQSLPLN